MENKKQDKYKAKKTHHLTMDVEQPDSADAQRTRRKLGDHQAAAEPVSGGVQHRPHLRNCPKK